MTHLKKNRTPLLTAMEYLSSLKEFDLIYFYGTSDIDKILSRYTPNEIVERYEEIERRLNEPKEGVVNCDYQRKD